MKVYTYEICVGFRTEHDTAGRATRDIEEWLRSDGVAFTRARTVDRFGMRGEWSVVEMDARCAYAGAA